MIFRCFVSSIGVKLVKLQLEDYSLTTSEEKISLKNAIFDRL
jgi:hypothetical protein